MGSTVFYRDGVRAVLVSPPCWTAVRCGALCSPGRTVQRFVRILFFCGCFLWDFWMGRGGYGRRRGVGRKEGWDRRDGIGRIA